MREAWSHPAVDVSSVNHFPSLGLSFPTCIASALDDDASGLWCTGCAGMAKVSLAARGQKGQSRNVANVATWC